MPKKTEVKEKARFQTLVSLKYTQKYFKVDRRKSTCINDQLWAGEVVDCTLVMIK